MNELPVELTNQIGLYLNTKDFINLSKVNKYLNKLIGSDNISWKFRSLVDYSVTLNGNFKTYKSKYISLYNKLCINCHRQTTVIHKFKNIRICNKCQKICPEYTLITKSSAKRELFLTDFDFKGVKYFEKPNSWNTRRKIKVYLLSELKDRLKYRFDSERDMIFYCENKRKEKFRRQILYITKFSILRSLLEVKFNINILLFSDFINHYTKGLFRRYILNISSKQNDDLAEILIYKIIEMKFLSDFNYDLPNLDYTYFKDLLKDILFTTDVDDFDNYNIYIREQINNIKIEYSSAFQRKQELSEYFANISYSLFDYPIKNYIKNGVGILEEIKLDYIEEKFIMENMDFLSITYDIFHGKSKKEIYSICVRDWVDDGNSLPEELHQRYKINN
jgi:hypothetical protein